jgi:hypothetical protein
MMRTRVPGTQNKVGSRGCNTEAHSKEDTHSAMVRAALLKYNASSIEEKN